MPLMLLLEGDGWARTVEPGQTVTFGRAWGGEGAGAGAGAELCIGDDPRLHRHCGTIVVERDGWELHNTGSWLSLRIVSTDRRGVDSLEPGSSVRVPWSNVSVQVHLIDRCHEFAARFVSEPAVPLAGFAPGFDGDGPTLAPVVVDRTAGYFRALVALCEPQLVDPTSNEIATDLQIALRLNRSGLERSRLTGKTVERRLDNCRGRFGLKETDDRGMSAGLERRDARRRLVELALLTGTVTVDDLGRLTPFGTHHESVTGSSPRHGAGADAAVR